MANPFVYSAPVGPEGLVDRDAEARAILDRAVGGHNSRLVAPRRYGKTSLLGRAASDIADEGWSAVYVNFFGVLTPSDVAERIDSAYAGQLRGSLASWFAGVRRVLRPTARIGGGVVPAQVEVATEPASQVPMIERLNLPVRLFEKTGRRVLVVFDEFQDVLTAGTQIDSVIRSEIESHGPAASYVFAGSHVGMMRELFSDKRRAFYGQAGAIELGPLPADAIASYVDSAFSKTSKRVGAALDPLLDVGAGHPQRTMLLAHWLWEMTAPGGEADESGWSAALDRVMQTEIRDELRGVWSGLPTGQRKVLALIAGNELSVFGRAAQRQLGLPRGGGLRTTVQSLVDLGEVVAASDRRSGYRLVDPLLARWVREGRPSST